MRETVDGGQPSRVDLAWVGFRIAVLQIKRGAENLRRRPSMFKRTTAVSHPVVVAEHRSRLKSGTPDERTFELGKIQNLRIAARSLNGLELKVGKSSRFGATSVVAPDPGASSMGVNCWRAASFPPLAEAFVS